VWPPEPRGHQATRARRKPWRAIQSGSPAPDLDPQGDAKSLKYSQTIRSTDDEPERPGRSLVTRSHDVIRDWAEERGGVPATVEGTRHGGRPGVLRFDFGGDDERLERISWDDWFSSFDARRLNFIYQEQLSDGRQSNFFRLDNPDREDG